MNQMAELRRRPSRLLGVYSSQAPVRGGVESLADRDGKRWGPDTDGRVAAVDEGDRPGVNSASCRPRATRTCSGQARARRVAITGVKRRARAGPDRAGGSPISPDDSMPTLPAQLPQRHYRPADRRAGGHDPALGCSPRWPGPPTTRGRTAPEFAKFLERIQPDEGMREFPGPAPRPRPGGHGDRPHPADLLR